ncbi:PREDICTED: aspartic proteinase nepenthesin-2-like [Prunus mume]|uniref:Aspartic proteinase nepenthesin-2-like n=1 Tax=Prunus mume TaxID=102107 RepID=A0ABM0PS47_PRUMU|nr:PREDICTED: aspartic proteinase nepenthesin-2-like [Prunus mume]
MTNNAVKSSAHISDPNLAHHAPSYNYLSASWTTYGISIGSIAGNLMLETLVQNVTSFLVGCSNFHPSNLLDLLGLAVNQHHCHPNWVSPHFPFAACLMSMMMSKSTNLVLDNATMVGLSYTQLLKSPMFAGSSPFSGYHYVKPEEIMVGHKHIKIPSKFVVPGYEGSGGIIIDTGASLTFMEKSIFILVAQEFEDQMADHERAVM